MHPFFATNDVLGLMCDTLAAMFLRGTLVSFGLTCKDIHHIAMDVLWGREPVRLYNMVLYTLPGNEKDRTRIHHWQTEDGEDYEYYSDDDAQRALSSNRLYTSEDLRRFDHYRSRIKELHFLESNDYEVTEAVFRSLTTAITGPLFPLVNRLRISMAESLKASRPFLHAFLGPSVTTLKLDFIPHNIEGVELGVFFREVEKKCPRISILALWFAGTAPIIDSNHDFDGMLARLLGSLKDLRSFSCSGRPLGSKTFECLAHQSSLLESLQLSIAFEKEECINREEVPPAFSTLARLPFPRLSRLEVTTTNFWDRIAPFLGKMDCEDGLLSILIIRTPSYYDLEIKTYEITPGKTIAALASHPSLATSLRHLELEGDYDETRDLTRSDVETMFLPLGFLVNLEHLTVSIRFFEEGKQTPTEGWLHSVSAFWRRLQYLSLSFSDRDGGQPITSLRGMLRLVKNCPLLREAHMTILLNPFACSEIPETGASRNMFQLGNGWSHFDDNSGGLPGQDILTNVIECLARMFPNLDKVHSMWDHTLTWDSLLTKLRDKQRTYSVDQQGTFDKVT